MPLTPQADLSPADWFVEAEADEWTKVCLGPSGFQAYARLELVDVDEDSEIDRGQLTVEALRRILPGHTATSDDCYFGHWDGSGWNPPDPPHLMWPADHAWFAAKDVDPDWIGLGGTQLLIDDLLADPALNVIQSTDDARHWEVR